MDTLTIEATVVTDVHTLWQVEGTVNGKHFYYRERYDMWAVGFGDNANEAVLKVAWEADLPVSAALRNNLPITISRVLTVYEHKVVAVA